MNSMRVFESISEWTEFRKTWTGDVGFVPTMGALHEGHAELVRVSQAQTQKTVVSIFVNPTQFNNTQDLEKYPRTVEKDLQILRDLKVDAVILPTPEQMYPRGYNYRVTEDRMSTAMEGLSRPGHFDGVLTVVMKLFNLVQPSKAFFGEKDFQQLQLVSEMARDFFMPLEVVPVPTVREQDGLAMSSRNVNLTAEQREIAPFIYKTLKKDIPLHFVKAQLEKVGFKVDYVEDWNGRRFTAAHLGNVRLIDNVEI